MGSFYQQILTILTTLPGNLVYHLILVFSIAGALPASINLWQASRWPAARRMLVGLGLLFFFQVALILTAVIAQAYPPLAMAVPSVDRAVTALSLTILIWLWAFPEPQRQADFATGLLIFLIVTLAIFSAVWWTNQSVHAGFNGSLPDLIWTGLSALLTAGGILLLLLRHPPGFGIGMGMFLLLFVGELAHLLLPAPAAGTPGGDFSGAVRLAQIAALPLVLTLPFRYPLILATPGSEARGTYQAIPSDLFRAFLSLALRSDPAQLTQSMTLTSAFALTADASLIISLQNLGTLIAIHGGYNLPKQEFIGAATFDHSLAPVIAEALRQNRPLHIPARSNLPDLQGLGDLLGMKLAGPLLAAPIQSPGVINDTALVILSVQAAHVWSATDQNYLADIARSFAEVFRLAQENRVNQEKVNQAGRALRNLQIENERLAQALRETHSSGLPASEEVERLQAELSSRKQEIALLRNALAQSDHKGGRTGNSSLTDTAGGTPSNGS